MQNSLVPPDNPKTGDLAGFKAQSGSLPPIVAVGASAGGLQAFTELFSNLPNDTGMGFVLVQHLDRTHESQLSDLLSRVTSMPIHEVTDGIEIKANQIHVIPPNTSLIVESGLLRLLPRVERGTYLPVDQFMQSMAEEIGSLGIGVILSGNG